MMMIFGGSDKRKGRGLQIQIRLFPSLTPEQWKQFLNIFTPESKLPQYFGKITANAYGNIKDQTGSSLPYMKAVVNCNDAKFEVKASEAERYYTDLFYNVFQVLENVVGRYRQARMLNWADIREFGEIISFRPKENMELLVQPFPMREIWSRLYVRDFFNVYGKNPASLGGLLNSKQNVLSKDDVKLVNEMAKSQKDYRGWVAKHADDIIALHWKLTAAESWEAGFKRDGGQKIKTGIDEALKGSQASEVFWAMMPVSEGDCMAIREFTSKILSA